MNEHDSENIKAVLESIGFSYVSDMKDADLIILNTCSIRENAHNKAFGMLGRIKHLKESKPKLMVGLCGCMAQEEVVINKILDKYKWLNFVFGTHNIEVLPKLIYEYQNNPKLNIDVYSNRNSIIEDIPVKRDNKFKAFVNIIYGCDKFCTYCIVPYTRGNQRSRDKEDILKEIDELVAEGYKEVTLLGQNVNAYGKDLDYKCGMSDLLESVAKTNIPRIRFVTSHPWDFTDEMIEVMKNNPNIMPALHLPVQSGSNRVLKLMGRRYTKEQYIELVNKIKENIPNISITTDIIVGFPNEEEEDFLETLSLVEELKFDGAFTFIYSKRNGTPAAQLEDNTPLSEKENRLYKLNELVNKHSLFNNQKLVGKKVKVLVEGESNKKGMLFGYTDTFKLINFPGSIDLIGEIIDVKVVTAKSFSLDGTIDE
jgi:tRNA-2-methylthio-N6-dimethylallyladenosine synthase